MKANVNRRSFCQALAALITGGTVATVPARAHGQFHDFGNGAPAVLHGTEAVVDGYIEVGRVTRNMPLAKLVTGVTLDGVPLNPHRVIAACDRKGWVYKYREFPSSYPSEHGTELRQSPNHPYTLQKHVLRGKVRIFFSQEVKR